MKQEYWRVHVSRLLVEICNNPQCSSLVTPLRILRNKLAEVAQRAAELNDYKLNGLMAELALYSVADPDDKDFDSQVKESVIKKGRAPRKLRSRKSKALSTHSLEILRLVASVCKFGAYWCPSNRCEYVTDALGSIEVFVYGSASTGAIRTLTTRGLVEEVAGAMNGYSRRITPAGLAYLAQLKQQHDRNRLLSKPHPGPAGTSEEAVGAELPQQQPAP